MRHDLACRQNALCIGSQTLRPCEWRHAVVTKQKPKCPGKKKKWERKGERRGKDKASQVASKHWAVKETSSQLFAFCPSLPRSEHSWRLSIFCVAAVGDATMWRCAGLPSMMARSHVRRKNRIVILWHNLAVSQSNRWSVGAVGSQLGRWEAQPLLPSVGGTLLGLHAVM